MGSELWFYFTTVLICSGYALLMHSSPQWKVYLSIGFGAFVIAGAVLVYFDAKKKEEDRTKIGQLERMVEDTKKETQKQESLIKDATDRAHMLADQLRMKTEEMANALKDRPQIDGEIHQIRIFPWQRASRKRTDDMVTTTGVVVFARVENHGTSTMLANWELSIEFPDKTVIAPQKWPVQKNMQIPCEDGPLNISKEEYLDAKTKGALQKTEERSGITVWMVRDVPINRVRTKDSFYTLTMRDNTGVIHALKRYNLLSVPQKCFGFNVPD